MVRRNGQLIGGVKYDNTSVDALKAGDMLRLMSFAQIRCLLKAEMRR